MKIDKWDDRYMDRARQLSKWSKDPDHQVGAVIVDPERFAVSEGFNGPPSRVQDTNLTDKQKTLRTLHAELNAILRARVPVKGFDIYVYPFSPCALCAAVLIQKGIGRVIYYSNKTLLPKWQASQEEAFKMFKERGVIVERYLR